MAYWIWYPGDFEIYHGMCQNFDREERGFLWPAFWKIDNCRPMVKFNKIFHIKKETSFIVHGKGVGYISLCSLEEKAAGAVHDEPKYPFDKEVVCKPGKYRIEVVVGNKSGLPCILVEGDTVFSDKDWFVTDMAHKERSVDCNEWYKFSVQDPNEIYYESKIVKPQNICQINQGKSGVLYDFGHEMTAETLIHFKKKVDILTLCYGESKEEALDISGCYQKQILNYKEEASLFGKWEDEGLYRTKKRAFRYLYIPDLIQKDYIEVQADFRYIYFPKRSTFSCDNKLIENIWNVAENTFRLASGVFFLDGIKRDRWIWSGDAYQCYLINQYLLGDKDICKRTMLALRGNDPVQQHLNTILDYSFYWIIGIADYYNTYGDLEFVQMIYPKMESLMAYCISQTNEHGFVYGRKEDWVFIDWSDIDIGEDKVISAEQMLFIRCYQSVIAMGKLVGRDIREYESRLNMLRSNVDLYFWDNNQGAYIDSYSTGRKKVSRHSNIFAVLFELVSEDKKKSILENVLENEKITAITTPYFKFWELEVLAKSGKYELTLSLIREYWGAMLEKGADTFWEEYNPNVSGLEQYAMYGDRFGKSLCHAWGAGPVYILGRYFLGVTSKTPGYKTYSVKPQTKLLGEFLAEVPVGDGSIKIKNKNGILTVWTNKPGGLLTYCGKDYELPVDEAITITDKNVSLNGGKI